MKSSKKVLLMSTYPIKGALTGGPLRVKAILEEYKKHFKSVSHVAVFSRYHHPAGYEPTDIAVRGDLAQATRYAPDTSDYLIGKAIATDKELRARVVAYIEQLHPDIIQIEQMFCWIGLKDAIKDLSYSPQITYSSHNIEWSMKKELLEGLGYKREDIAQMIEDIKSAEYDLASKASAVFAVTKADGESLVAMGAKSYTLARNGVFPLNAQEKDIEYWRAYFAQRGIEQIAVFIGSAHPPNIQGFKEMIGFGLGFLKRNQAIVLAGDVGTNIMDNLDRQDAQQFTSLRRLISVGRLSHPRLQGLLSYAHTILLPITEGGGSNLKTAEAIASRKPVVATAKAYRSFDEFKDAPQVLLADTRQKFKDSIRRSFEENNVTKLDSKVDVNSVLWSACLKPMSQKLEEI